MIKTKILILLCVICVAIAGCLKEESSKEELKRVPPAPKQLYLKTGQFESFVYWGHNITVAYVSSFPKQTVRIVVDGVEKVFERELNASPRGIYWKESNLTFVLKPVIWEFRNGEKIPIYEKTWNTTELYFEVRVVDVKV